jgi:predicted  nucleic acid-binding Zn-ribbon protein
MAGFLILALFVEIDTMVIMSELTNISYNRLQDSLARLEAKTKALLDAVEQARKERLSLEAKIEDAQGRIQNILSKLPAPTDNGQMDLLAANQQDAQ